jgi:hypothetical protein
MVSMARFIGASDQTATITRCRTVAASALLSLLAEAKD